MEQLKDLISFSQYIKDEDESVYPFSFTISEPFADDEHSAYCILSCPYFRDKEFKIFGVDGEQAIELSLNFVAATLGEKTIIDVDGNPVALPMP